MQSLNAEWTSTVGMNKISLFSYEGNLCGCQPINLISKAVIKIEKLTLCSQKARIVFEEVSFSHFCNEKIGTDKYVIYPQNFLTTHL